MWTRAVHVLDDQLLLSAEPDRRCGVRDRGSPERCAGLRSARNEPGSGLAKTVPATGDGASGRALAVPVWTPTTTRTSAVTVRRGLWGRVGVRVTLAPSAAAADPGGWVAVRYSGLPLRVRQAPPTPTAGWVPAVQKTPTAVVPLSGACQQVGLNMSVGNAAQFEMLRIGRSGRFGPAVDHHPARGRRPAPPSPPLRQPRPATRQLPAAQSAVARPAALGSVHGDGGRHAACGCTQA